MGLWPWRSKRDRATARYHVKHENSVRREFATTTLPVVSAWTSPIFWLARVHRARRRSRGNHASRYAFSHLLRCRPFRTEFDPSPFLPVVPHGRNGDSGAWLLAVRDAPAAAVHRPWTSIDTLRHLAHRISGFRVAFDVIASGDEDVVTTERPEAIRDQLSTLG